jgi:alanyl-tRNA synthetase
MVDNGTFKTGDILTATINTCKRNQIAGHHTATHLLQKALRTVLGTHVAQAGSLVSEDSLRFDFSHFKALTKDELLLVEKTVNSSIRKNLPVLIEEMSINDARQKGATALFGEKYGDVVRAVSVGDDTEVYSMELCGGTHVKRTGDIGSFKIISETSIGSGVRRIEAVAGKSADKYFNELEQQFDELSAKLKIAKKAVVNSVEKLLEDLKQKESEISSLKSKLISGEIDEYIKTIKVINDIKVISFNIKGIDVKSLRDMADKIREKLPSSIAVITTETDDKISFVVSVTADLIKGGYSAGKIAKTFASKIDGSGGGKADFAQGGSKNINKTLEVIKNTEELAQILK